MQIQSSPLVPNPSTLFGSREPDAVARRAQADLRACRASLRNGSKTFLAASLLLPRAVHEPASALYAFCRLADDAVDATGERGDAVGALRERLRLAYAGIPMNDPADRALAVVVARHGIPSTLFDALLEGFEWDEAGRPYETLEELHDYAARVAGAVGAMMALLMGVRSAEGLARACDLGVAMQLSNIARDVGEDARMGRLYLPRRWMRDAGIDVDTWLAQPVHTPALGAVVRRLLDAADGLYRRVGTGVACLPMACRPGINAARFMYAEIGHEVARRGHDSVNGRARVPGFRKAALLMRSIATIAPAASAAASPPLPANRFLVDASVASDEHVSLPRSIAQRVAWTVELFARLEQRDRARAQGRSQRGGITT